MADSLLKKRTEEHIEVAKKVLADAKLQGQVALASSKIIEAYKKGGKTIFFGNGGSAADAQHMAAEFLGKYMLDRKPLPSVALTTNTSSLTAIANDYGYKAAFSRQLEALAGRGDVAIGISTSGNSENVVEAVKRARALGVFTIALVGAKKCELDSLADICIKAPSESTPRIQEMHALLLHTICEEVEAGLFG